MSGVLCVVLPASLAGRCSTGEERGQGCLIHAIRGNPARTSGGYVEIYGAAFCGAKPGRRSVGWSHRPDKAVTCKKCLKKAALTTTPESN